MIATGLHPHERARVCRKRDNAWGEWKRREVAIPRSGRELVAIGDDAVDLRHRCEARRVDRRCAAGYHDPRRRAVAASPADRLTGLFDRFIGDRAAVDDDGIATDESTDRFAFGDVETAPERDDTG